MWWICAREDIDLTIRHRPGVEMETADTLSRAALSEKHHCRFQALVWETPEPQMPLTNSPPSATTTHGQNIFSHSLQTTQLRPPDSHLHQLMQAACNRRRNSFRPSTSANYLSSIRTFVQFCVVYSIPLQKVDHAALAAFTELLIAEGLTISTIRNYFSAIKVLFV